MIRNQILSGSAIDQLQQNVEEESIDMILTSPPYDDLRTYNNST